MVKKVKKLGLKKKAGGEAPAGSPKALSSKPSPKLEAALAKVSPKVSPKESPKGSPKAFAAPAPAAPVDEAAKEARRSKTSGAARRQARNEGPPAPVEATARLTQEAIAVIKEGLQKHDIAVARSTYIPETWPTKYKDVLGGYKKFVLAHPDKFVVRQGSSGNYLVGLAGGPPPPSPKQTPAPPSKAGGASWKELLAQAWTAFCQNTPKDKRDASVFAAALPAGVREKAAASTHGGAKQSPAQAPGSPSAGAQKSTAAGEASAGPPAKKRKKRKAQAA